FSIGRVLRTRTCILRQLTAARTQQHASCKTNNREHRENWFHGESPPPAARFSKRNSCPEVYVVRRHRVLTPQAFECFRQVSDRLRRALFSCSGRGRGQDFCRWTNEHAGARSQVRNEHAANRGEVCYCR